VREGGAVCSSCIWERVTAVPAVFVMEGLEGSARVGGRIGE
jgi:hypothetical protein